MGYYMDLSSITMEDFKGILRSMELIPSWKILEENVDANLDAIKGQNINNLDELLRALKSKESIQNLSKGSGLSEKYLSVLNRVVKGYKQKPNNIRDFPSITEDTIKKLEDMGIKNTLKIYDWILTPQKRDELFEKTGVEKKEILKIAKLADLSRIRWVNHTFAHVLFESGFDTLEKVSKADYKALYTTIKKLNEERNIYNAHIGERDMKMVIESAQLLDSEVEY